MIQSDALAETSAVCTIQPQAGTETSPIWSRYTPGSVDLSTTAGCGVPSAKTRPKQSDQIGAHSQKRSHSNTQDDTSMSYLVMLKCQMFQQILQKSLRTSHVPQSTGLVSAGQQPQRPCIAIPHKIHLHPSPLHRYEFQTPQSPTLALLQALATTA